MVVFGPVAGAPFDWSSGKASRLARAVGWRCWDTEGCVVGGDQDASRVPRLAFVSHHKIRGIVMNE